MVKANTVLGPEKVKSEVLVWDHTYLFHVDGDEIECAILESVYSDASSFQIGGWGWPGGGGWEEKEQYEAEYPTLDAALTAATTYLADLEWEDEPFNERLKRARNGA